MFQTDHTDFKSYIDNLSKSRRTFVVESKRTTNSIFVNDKMVLIAKKERKKEKVDKQLHKSAINLFAQVQKSVNRFIKQVDFEVKKVRQLHPSTDTNRNKWRSITDDDIFYYIDIKHCYWRIAFLKGYISKNLYESSLLKPELKIQRNISLALIIAPKKRQYYKNGVLTVEISEERSMYRIIYDNIRFTAYNLMGKCKEHCGEDFIAYRTDGIMVGEESVNDVVEILHNEGFNCIVTECRKIDHNTYLYDNKKKKKF